jgi:hypothetical protein
MTMSGIGLLNEKPLHASLKQWCARPGDRFEVDVDGFVIDLVRDDLLMEIQTRNFACIKSKLINLARLHRVRLIYPIVQEKWIVRLARDDCGKVTRRKSPRTGRVEDLFGEMVSFPELMCNPNFSLAVLLIREEEARRYEGKRRWSTRGWATQERRLLAVAGQRLFEKPTDWLALVPQGLKAFTANDMAAAIGIGVRLAQQMAYCLRKAGAVKLISKRGRANLYRVAGAEPRSCGRRRPPVRFGRRG